MAVPTLGYPSRTAAVLALKTKGLEDEQIAERIGESVYVVRTTLIQAENRRRPAGETPERLAVHFPDRERLEPAAYARRLSPTQLATKLLFALVEADLIDAVLDDGVTTPRSETESA